MLFDYRVGGVQKGQNLDYVTYGRSLTDILFNTVDFLPKYSLYLIKISILTWFLVSISSKNRTHKFLINQLSLLGKEFG